MANFGTAVFSAILNNTQLLGAAAQTNAALGGIGAGAARGGSAITTGITVPIVAMGAAAVGEARKLDNAWAEVLATYNDPGGVDAVKRMIVPTGLLGEEVTKISTNLGLNRAEVIENLGVLSQMGFVGKDATTLLNRGLEFSVATGQKLEDGLLGTTAIMQTFGVEGADLEKTLRQLNSVENDTAASGEDLMFALRRAGGAAANLTNDAFSADEAIGTVAAGMAVLKERGQETMRSGDALRAMFQRLYTADGPKTQALWDKMGVSMKDAQGNLKPFPQLLNEIAGGYGNLTQQEQLAFSKQAIGVEFGPLFDMLIEDIDTTDGKMSTFAQTMDLYGNSTRGTINYNRELEVRLETLDVKIGRLKAAWGLLVDSARPVIEAMLKPIIDWLTRMITKFSEASPSTQRFVIIVAAVAAAIGPLLLIFAAFVAAAGAIAPIFTGLWALFSGGIGILGRIFGAFGRVMSVVRILGGILPALQYAWIGITAALSGAGGVMGILGAAFTALTGPIGILLIAIVGIVALFVIMQKKGSALGEFVRTALGAAFSIFKSALGDLKAAFVSLMPALKVIGALAGGVVLVAILALAAAFKVVAVGVRIMAAIIGAVFGAIVAVAQWLYDVLVGHSIIPDLINAIVMWFRMLGTLVGGVLQIWKAVVVTIFSVAAATVKAIVTVLVAVVVGIFRAWVAVMKAILNAWKAVFTGIWNAIKAVVMGVVNAIRAIITAWLGVIRGVIRTVMAAIRGDWQGVWNGIRSIVSSITGGIRGVISAFMGAIRGVISAGIGAIRGVWSAGWNGLKGVVSAVVGTIKSIVGGLSSFIERVVGTISRGFDRITAGAGAVRGVLGRLPGLNKGGLVPGVGNKDTEPYMLTPGEFVVNKTATRRIGPKVLQKWNDGGEPPVQIAAQDALAPTMPAPSDVLTGLRAQVAPTVNPAANGLGRGDLTGAVVDKSVQQSIVINNPVAEPASESLPKVMRNLQFSGALG